MTATSGHTIRLLTAEETARYMRLGWTLCSRNTCQRTHAYLAHYVTSYGKHERLRLCGHHGGLFADKNNLNLPVPEQPGGVQTARSRSGLTFAVCGRCRHWLGRTTTIPGQCIDGCRCTDPCHAGIPSEVAS